MSSEKYVCGSLLLLLACDPSIEPCIADVRAGDTLEVTVGKRLSGPASAPDKDPIENLPSCHLDDVRTGTTYLLKLGKDQTGNDECLIPSCPLDFPSNGSSYEASTPPHVRNFVCYSHRQKVGAPESCQAQRIVSVGYFVKRSEIFDPPPTPALPPVVLTRMLLRGESSTLQCPTPAALFPLTASSKPSEACSDSYAVTLKKAF